MKQRSGYVNELIIGQGLGVGQNLKLFPRSRIQINVDYRSVQSSSTAAEGASAATGPP